MITNLDAMEEGGREWAKGSVMFHVAYLEHVVIISVILNDKGIKK